MAHAQMKIMPGPGYVLTLSYLADGKTYEYTQPMEIKGDLQYALEFDPNKWVLKGTALAITGTSTVPSDNAQGNLPPWMRIAYGELGQNERIPSGENPRVIEYIKSIPPTAANPSVDTQWSSHFINWVVVRAGYTGTNSGASRSWLNWGYAISPQLGCVALFWRDSPTGNLAHAGFFVGETADTIRVLGGNQSNSVSIASLPKSHFLGCRWPVKT